VPTWLFFRRDLSADGVGLVIDRIQRRLKSEQPMLKHVLIEAESTAPAFKASRVGAGV